jgi:hypothetical protein
MLRLRYLCFTIISLLVLLPALVQAQGNAISLAYGQRVTGALSDQEPEDLYAFAAQQGDMITVTMDAQDGTLDPFLIMLDGAQQVVLAVDNDGGGSGANGKGNSRLRFVVPSAGLYTIKATAANAGEGGNGNYELFLTLENPTPTPSSTANEPIIAPFPAGSSSIRADLNDDTPFHVYALSGKRDETLTFALEIQGDVQAGAYLYDTSFADRLATAQLGQPLTATLPDDGLYFVVVARLAANGAGTFTLRREGTTESTATPTKPDEVGTLLVAGQTQTGDLGARIADLYRFEVMENATARLDVVANTDTMILLVDSSFTQVAVALSSLRETPLPRAGMYYVLVVRRQGPNDPNGLQYSIALHGGILAPTPRATAAPLVISYGQTVRGTLSNEAYQLRYTLIAQTGESIRVSMIAANSTLDPLVALLDPAGNLLIANDDTAPGIADALFVYDIPADGSYTILATRSGEATGTTSGAFTLLVTLPQDDEPTPTPAPASTLGGGIEGVTYGSRVSGSIDASKFVYYYSFQGETGDVITIQMGRVSASDLDPALYLYYYDTNGMQTAVAFNDNYADGTLNAAIQRFSLPATGVYLIVATRAGAANGTTTGNFVLTLAKAE